ncbi:MAG: carbohydrate ABC transporter substrate-binding protein [Clostridia bacterium]|nr:carbohydrate ABC transporter substrate-binding protein [Clostridia bacterium]NLS85102.1 ABC transporter substrate-binding protein [Oscillospiraceae bacterium]
MKKALALTMALIMTLGTMAGCGAASSSTAASTAAPASTASSAAPAAEGKVLNIYCWNDEYRTRMTALYPDYDDAKQTIGDVKVNWVSTPNENNAYQNMLDEALLKQGSAADDDKIDLFLIEADYARKYTSADAGVAMSIADVGLTDADLADQFQYTKDVVSDENGVQRGTSWQGCPGVMIYNRTIAKAVLGSDDPAEVQKAVATWDDFNATAKEMKAQGYYISAGWDDSYRVYSNNVSAPWVTDDGTIKIDPSIEAWTNDTKALVDAGYVGKYDLWASEWGAGAKGTAFSYFGPAWFIDFCLAGYTMDKSEADGGKAEVGNGTWGDWAVCAGPQGYFWGGTWMCAAEGSDNTALVADIMKTMTCNADTAKELTAQFNEFANNKTAMKAIAEDKTFGSAFLGGQNFVAAMYDSADKIDMKNLTAYDQGLNETYQKYMHEYFAGTTDKETSLSNFYKEAIEKYPDLKQG